MATPSAYRFGPFRLDIAAYRLTQHDRSLDVPPKVIDLLALMVSQPSALISKDAILARLWPDVAVTDNAITQVVSELRQALGDSPTTPAYVQTVPRRGYRFIAEVEALGAAPAVTEPRTSPGSERRHTIAVSDFQNLTEDADIAWLGSGIAETLTNDLRAVRDFTVIDRAGLPEMARRGVLEAARAASLDSLVVGSYQRVGERLRITARILNAQTGEAVAHARADGPASAAFDVQDRLVRQLLTDLKVPVSDAASARIGTHETSSMEAYRALTEGRLKLESLDVSLVPAAVRDFDRALTLDPRYALAYAGLADARFWLYEDSRMRNKPDRDELRLAIGHARRAVELDPGLGEAHASLALSLMAAGAPDEAVESGRRAVALEPNDWRHWFRLGVAAWGEERFTCLAEVERRYPEFAHGHFSAAMISVARGDLRRAAETLERGLSRTDAARSGPQRYPACGLHWLLGLIRWALDADVVAARKQFERELATAGTFLYAVEYSMNAWDALGFLELAEGRPDQAVPMFAHALEAYPDHARSLIGQAIARRAMNDEAGAATLMQRADDAILELQASQRTSEAAQARACWHLASGRPDDACEVLLALIETAPVGTTGWNLPVEPWLVPHRQSAACQRLFARLADRAR